MADTRLLVTFVDIAVDSDGDPVGKGEICWSLKVDGAVISHRDIGNPYKISSGDSITLGQNTTVTKSGNANLVVSGSVSDKDGASKDDTAHFTDTWTSGNNWGIGPRVQRLKDRNLDVTLNYLITRV